MGVTILDDNDDDSHISERLQRFIETFPISDINEDEFHLTSTGQTVRREDFPYYHDYENSIKTNSHRSMSNDWSNLFSYCNKRILHSSLCTALLAICWEPQLYLFLIAPILVGAVLFHCRRRHCAKDSSSASKTKTTPTKTKPNTFELITNGASRPKNIHVHMNTNIPHLAPDANDDKLNIKSKSRQVSRTAATNITEVISVPRSINTTTDDAHHLVSLVSDLKEKCEHNGIDFDPKIAWKWAIQQQTTDKIINAQLFTSYCDRNMSQKQHNDNLIASREDKDWLNNLFMIRLKYQNALMKATYQCVVGTFLIVIAEPIVFIIHLCYTLSSSELLCYGTGTSLDPTIQLPKSQLFWYHRYAPTVSYIDTYTSSAFGEAVTCAAYTGGRIVFSIGSLLALYIISWIFHQLAISDGIQQVTKSGILLCSLSAFGWLRKYHLYQMSFCLVVIVTSCYSYITYQHKIVCNKFRNLKSSLPQVSEVNEYVLWFDEAIEIIRTLPILFVTFILALLYV